MSSGRDQPHLAVLGAGVMGTGIATLAVGHGLAVRLVEVDPTRLATAGDRVAHQLRLARLTGALAPGAPTGELVTGADLAQAAGAGTVIEAVTERADVKARVLADVSALVSPGTLLVSTTSAIPVDELAGAVTRPAQLAGVHFMNPPYLVRTVEVIRGRRTGEAAMAAVARLLAALDREPVLVGDGPGFVINRILQRMVNEAARIVEERRASPQAIDAAFTGCLGHRSGPLATADLIGLDNVVDSLRVLHERTGDAGYRPCGLLLEMVRDGRLGRKSGRGFFEYEGTLS